MIARASDSERERCAKALSEHAAAGRLGYDELEERLARVYGATYRLELRALLMDLPRDYRRRFARAASRIDRMLLRAHASAFGLSGASLTGVWALAGSGDYWPALMLGPWGVVLAWHAGGSWSVRRMLRRRVGELPPGRGAARRGRLTA